MRRRRKKTWRYWREEKEEIAINMKLIYKNPNITVIKRNLKNIKVERHKVQ